eukprot:NODE_66_length_25735_cov_0.318497.p12 type:complete len:334 gc:universal NODE_66_length_25735_cov_0.318497:7613-6612(-)
MRIGPSQQPLLTSVHYNLEPLTFTEQTVKCTSPYLPCDQHNFSSLITTKEEIEATLKEMDKQFNSNFLEFIKDENACDRIGPHLAMMCRYYPLKNIVLVIEFITESWNLLNISKLLTSLSFDWNPDFTGKVMNLYFRNFSEKERLRIAVFILYGEDAETAAMFLRECMNGWAVFEQSSFIQFLEQCLEWNKEYNDEFLVFFLCHLQLKCKEVGINTVLLRYNMNALPASKKLKKLFEFPVHPVHIQQTSDELVSLDLRIFITISIHKAYTAFKIDDNEISENQRVKAIAWIGTQSTLISIDSIDEITEEDDSESCNEQQSRSFFRQILDRLRL